MYIMLLKIFSEFPYFSRSGDMEMCGKITGNISGLFKPEQKPGRHIEFSRYCLSKFGDPLGKAFG